MVSQLNPSIIGQAEKSHNALLYRALDGTGVDEVQWITLVLAVGAGGSIGRAEHTSAVANITQFGPSTVHTAIEQLLSAALLDFNGDHLLVSAQGSAFVQRVRAETSPVIARAYAGVSPDDLATTARVLTEITARLSADLGQKSR